MFPTIVLWETVATAIVGKSKVISQLNLMMLVMHEKGGQVNHLWLLHFKSFVKVKSTNPG